MISGCLAASCWIFASNVAFNSWIVGSFPNTSSSSPFNNSSVLWILTSVSNPASIVSNTSLAIDWWPALDGWTPAPAANIIRTNT